MVINVSSSPNRMPTQRRYGRLMIRRGSCGKETARSINAPADKAQARVHMIVNSWVVTILKYAPVTIAREEVNNENARPAGSLRRRPNIHRLITMKINERIDGRMN